MIRYDINIAMLTEKSTSQSAGVIERPVIDATHDFQMVDRPILATTSDATSTPTDQVRIGDVQQHWDQVLGLLQAGTLRADSPELLALVKDLKSSGVLPNGPLSKDQLLTFHYWLSTMPVGDVPLDQLTFLEGLFYKPGEIASARHHWTKWWFLMPLMHLINMRCTAKLPWGTMW